MKNNNNDEELIKRFYLEAWKCLQIEDYKSVITILHKKMNSYLYDLSLTILENNHIDPSKSELKHLIEKVDKKLEDYFNTNKEEEELINDDNFVKSIFKKRKYKK